MLLTYFMYTIIVHDSITKRKRYFNFNSIKSVVHNKMTTVLYTRMYVYALLETMQLLFKIFFHIFNNWGVAYIQINRTYCIMEAEKLIKIYRSVPNYKLLGDHNYKSCFTHNYPLADRSYPRSLLPSPNVILLRLMTLPNHSKDFQ